MDDIAIDVLDQAPTDWLSQVDAGLDRHNSSAAPLHEVRPLAAFCRLGSGALAGGAVGRTWGACCELQQLWVHEAHRHRGLASRLLAGFEQRAQARGCRVFYLTTFSFQAPDFYRKQGYAVQAKIAGFAPGVVKYLMCKDVLAEPDGSSATAGLRT